MDNPRIKTICEWTKHNHKNGNEIACTCTGTFLLAETGLLDGCVATTNWQFAEIFKRQYPKVNLQVDRILTEDNGLYCTGAATAFMNLCLHLIEKYGSPDLASRCAKSLLVDTVRQSQSAYFEGYSYTRLKKKLRYRRSLLGWMSFMYLLLCI